MAQARQSDAAQRVQCTQENERGGKELRKAIKLPWHGEHGDCKDHESSPGCRGSGITSCLLSKVSCQTRHAIQALLTAAIKNIPVSPEKCIFLPANAFLCHPLTFIPPPHDTVLRSKMYKWTSDRLGIQYLAIPTEIANGTSCYWEVNIPQRILAYVSHTTLKTESFATAVQKARLDHFKSEFSNFNYEDKGLLKKK